MHSGKCEITWFLEGVTKYHRTLSEIINTLIEKRYTICEVVEAIPNEIALKKRPDFIDEFHKTTCIIFKVKVSKSNICRRILLMFYIKGIHNYLDKKNIAFIIVIIGVVIGIFYPYAVIIYSSVFIYKRIEKINL